MTVGVAVPQLVDDTTPQVTTPSNITYLRRGGVNQDELFELLLLLLFI